MAKSKITYKKVKRQITPLQRKAALENLAKARKMKSEYAKLRSEGFSRETIAKAQQVIKSVLDRFSNYSPESNPAVAQLLDEIGSYKTKEELDSMTNAEYYKFATSLRAFLNNPLSSSKGIENLTNRLVEEIVFDNETRRTRFRRALVNDNPLSRNKKDYLHERTAFIKQNEDIARQAFKLYRQLESTHAGLILRNNISPEAYGSDNLIVDLFDFIENDYDQDFDAAVAYWTEMIEEQYAAEQEISANFDGKELPRFDWKLQESYESFARRKRRE